MNTTMFNKSCKICLKRSLNYYINKPNNLLYLISKFHGICDTSFNHIRKVCTYKFNTNHVRNWSDNSNHLEIEAKIIELYKYTKSNKTVDQNLLISVINHLETTDYDISDVLVTMLLDWCEKVELYDQSLKVKQELVNHVWNIIKMKKPILKLNYYHTLLQTYREINYTIDVKQFLKDMTVIPECETYSLLLQIRSKNNHELIDNITLKILEDQLMFNQTIYNSLKYAYAAHGNVEGVKQTIQIAENKTGKKLFTENDVYLMYALAENGKFKDMIEIIKNNKLSILNALKLVRYLSFSETDFPIEDVLECSEPLTKKEHDVTYTVNQLMNTEHITDLCKLIVHVPTTVELEYYKKQLNEEFLDKLITLNVDNEIILKIINFIRKQNPKLMLWEKAIQISIEKNNTALICKIIDEIKAIGDNIKPKILEELLILLLKYDNKTDMYLILAKISQLNNTINYDLFFEFLLPTMNTENLFATVTEINKYVPTKSVVEPLVQFLIRNGRLHESIHTCTYFKKKLDCQHLLISLFKQYKRTKDIESCIHILFKLTYNGIGFAPKFAGYMLRDLKDSNAQYLVSFLNAAKDNNAPFSSEHIEYVQKQLFEKNITEENKDAIFQAISQFHVDPQKNYNTSKFIHPAYMNETQLYYHYKKLKRKKLNVRGVLRKLLIFACKNNNIELVKEIIKDIEKYKNFKWSPGMIMYLFDFYVKNDETEEALCILKQTRSQFPNFLIDNFKILNLCITLVKKNKLDTIYSIMDDTCINHKLYIQVQFNTFFDLLLKKHPDHIPNMLSYFDKYYHASMQTMLRNFVYTEIHKNNIKTAVKMFQICAERYNTFLAQKEIFLAIAQRSSESAEYDRLMSKVYEIVKSNYGENLANVRLLIVYAQCNKVPELKALFKTCTIHENVLSRQLVYLKIDDLEEILNALLQLKEIVPKSCLKIISNIISIKKYEGKDVKGRVLKLKENVS